MFPPRGLPSFYVRVPHVAPWRLQPGRPRTSDGSTSYYGVTLPPSTVHVDDGARSAVVDADSAPPQLLLGIPRRAPAPQRQRIVLSPTLLHRQAQGVRDECRTGFPRPEKSPADLVCPKPAGRHRPMLSSSAGFRTYQRPTPPADIYPATSNSLGLLAHMNVLPRRHSRRSAIDVQSQGRDRPPYDCMLARLTGIRINGCASGQGSPPLCQLSQLVLYALK